MQPSTMLAIAFALAGLLGTAHAEDESVSAKAHELSLPHALELAENNARVELAEEKASALASKRDLAGKAFLPSVRVRAFVGSVPDVSCLDDNCTTTTNPDLLLRPGGVGVGGSLLLSQPLTSFGKADFVQRAATHGVAMARHDLASEKVEQKLRTAEVYYGALLARELIAMLEEGRREIHKAEKDLNDKLEAGDGTANLQDRFRLRNLLSLVDAQLADARAKHGAALAALQALTGRDEARVSDPALLPLDLPLGESLATFVGEDSEVRSELQSARSRLSAAVALRDFATSRFRPDLKLLGRLDGALSSGIDNPPSAFADDPYNRLRGSLSIVLDWKLDPLSQEAKRRDATAKASQAKVGLDIIEAFTSFELEKSYETAVRTKERLAASERGEKNARAWIASVLQAQALGVGKAKDLADAYVSYFTMQGSRLQAVFDWNLAVLRLRRASARPLLDE